MNTDQLYLGDCIEGMKIIPDKYVDLIVTDPPYEFISKNPKGGGFMKNENKQHLHKIDNTFGMTYNPDIFLQECKRIMKKMNMYVFTNKSLLAKYIQFAEENKYKWEILIWAKSNPVPINNGHYLIDKEYCIYIKESGATFNSKIGYENYFTIYNYPIGKKETKHPTEKPIEFIKRMIKISSNEGDIVLDAYAGSGTTLLASRQLNRKYIGFELLEEFYKIAQERIDKYNATKTLTEWN